MSLNAFKWFYRFESLQVLKILSDKNNFGYYFVLNIALPV